MRYFYLDRRIHFLFIFVFLMCNFFGLLFIFLLSFTLYILLLFFFRKRKGIIKDEIIPVEKTTLYVPVSGKIKNILVTENQRTELVITVPFHQGFGIYLPFGCEIKELKFSKKAAHFRFSNISESDILEKSCCDLVLKSQKNDEIFIKILKCTFGIKPNLKVMVGDRGKRGANIGLLPFGGTLTLSIPPKYEILVQKNQSIIAGESLMAGSDRKI